MVALDTQNFDAIAIGSGIGGLTAAALLSKIYGKQVLVLEQHFTPGGFTHSFQRPGKFHWDVGLHYVGDMDKGSTGRAVFDFLTDGNLHWQKMPELFEKFVYPDFTFDVYGDPVRFQADLIRQFPQEKAAIARYFRDVQRSAFWFGMHPMVEIFPLWLQPLLKTTVRYFGAIARQTTQQYLDRHFHSDRLKALLTSQWADYGLPPSQSCFGIHGTIATHYLHGGWYPVGGAQEIAKHIIPAIERTGGRVLTQRQVVEILVESGKVKGVKARRADGKIEHYRAKIVISDAGAFNTYLKLISPEYPLSYREEIREFPKGNSASILYLGLKESPERLGFNGENHWIYTTYDHETVKMSPDRDRIFNFCYLSFPSLKDPLAEAHTAEIIALVDYEAFSQWRDTRWKHRGTDYAELKQHITDSLIDLVERYYPGFRDLIAYSELSTPLTIEHFDASDRGAIYGIPCIPKRLDLPWIGARTPIQNLYLTGSDAFCPGIMGAMMGGVKTVGIVRGTLGFFQIMGKIMQAQAIASPR